jgi:hypothetical protein
MSDSIHPMIRKVVDKLDPSVSPEEAVEYFWSKCKPGTMETLGERNVERFERDIRKHHKSNQLRAREVQPEYT